MFPCPKSAEESRWLLEVGLADQSILELPEDQRPEIINDRDRQMKAKPIQWLCDVHRVPQLFSRPRAQRQSLHRIGLQHCQACPGISGAIPG